MGEVTHLAVDALTKEMKYESFAEKEELERERKTQSTSRVKLEEIKEKMVIQAYIGMLNQNK